MESQQSSVEKGISRKRGIQLVVEEGIFSEGRIVMRDGIETKTHEPRSMIDVANLRGVANVAFLHYGEATFSPDGVRFLKTEPLGACVALTFWSPDQKHGVIAHFVTTQDAVQGLHDVLDQLHARSLSPADLEARLFGGGASDRGNENKPGSQRLVQELWEGLSRAEVPLLEADLYGSDVRCIVMALETGEVFDYPYEADAVAKNDTPIENRRLPVRSLPPLPYYR